MFHVATTLARATLRAPRALTFFAAPMRADLPRTRGLATAPPPLVFYVKRADTASAFTSVEVPATSDVSALVKASVAELRIDASPGAVTLALESGGPPLDARRALSDAFDARALALRPSLVATVRTVDVASLRRARVAELPLPPPLVFSREDVGGEPMMVATLAPEASGDPPRPLFLSPNDHTELKRFIVELPSSRPQMLLLTGTIKSGKTCIVNDVIPGLLAAQHATSAPGTPRPVIVRCSFELGADCRAAAIRLTNKLHAFSRSVGLGLTKQPHPELSFPDVAQDFAAHVRDAGGVLWLLLDELQAPILASSPVDVAMFTQRLKTLVELCSPYARVVGTGSGVISLLTAIRGARVNGFSFAHAAAYISLGREPRKAVALAMAERIIGAYARSWPAAMVALVTPERVTAVLARSAHDELTSPRPALVAFLLSCMGDGRKGSPDKVLATAVKAVLYKLHVESVQDALTALERMSVAERFALRVLADSGQTAEPSRFPRTLLSLCSNNFYTADLAEQLCEESPDTRLLPPYGTLVRSVVSRDGDLAIVSNRGGFELVAPDRLNLNFLSDYSGSFSETARAAISTNVLETLARGEGGEGAWAEASSPAARTVEELGALPVVKVLLRVLDEHSADVKNSDVASQSSRLFSSVQKPDCDSAARADFMRDAGLHILRWVRHAFSHVSNSDAVLRLRETGITGPFVVTLVRAAVAALVTAQGSAFEINSAGVLKRAARALKRAPASAPR